MNSKTTRSKMPQNLLIGLWFLLCSVLVLWLGSANKTEFDPRMRLSQALMSLQFESTIVDAISRISPAASYPRIFHITQGQCFCEWLAKPHQNSLNAWAEQNDYSSQQLSLIDHPQLAAYVPSTPAVIAIDKDQQLIYLGPYSRGSGCFAQSGEIDAQLKVWTEQSAGSTGSTGSAGIADDADSADSANSVANIKQAVVDTDASGCYCESKT